MLEHLGESEAANRLLRALEAVCRDGPAHRATSAARATTAEVGDAIAGRVHDG